MANYLATPLTEDRAHELISLISDLRGEAPDQHKQRAIEFISTAIVKELMLEYNFIRPLDHLRVGEMLRSISRVAIQIAHKGIAKVIKKGINSFSKEQMQLLSDLLEESLISFPE